MSDRRRELSKRFSHYNRKRIHWTIRQQLIYLAICLAVYVLACHILNG